MGQKVHPKALRLGIIKHGIHAGLLRSLMVISCMKILKSGSISKINMGKRAFLKLRFPGRPIKHRSQFILPDLVF